jgi:hypothetical protein
MRILRRVLPIMSVIVLASCGSDAAAPDTDVPGASEQIGLAVRAVNTGTGSLVIETHSPVSIHFCYQQHGCMTLGGGWYSINAGHGRLLDQSHPDSTAIGARINFVVLEGQGRAEVIRGVAYRSTNGGFLDFTEGPIVHTSAPFAAGDTVRYTFGTVQ